MNKDFIPYEEALALKELGCDVGYHAEYRQWDGGQPWLELNQDMSGGEICFTTECRAPLYQEAFQWFRDYHEWPIETWIEPYITTKPREHKAMCWRRGEYYDCGVYPTYEAAQLACLKKAIELVKTNLWRIKKQG